MKGHQRGSSEDFVVYLLQVSNLWETRDFEFLETVPVFHNPQNTPYLPFLVIPTLRSCHRNRVHW